MIGTFSIDGESYPRSIVLSSCDDPNVVEYNIRRRYDRFEAFVGMTDTADSVLRSSIEFEVDGDLVETVEISVGEPSEVDLSVKDALTLTMATTNLADPEEMNTCQLDPIGPALGTPRFVNMPG